MMLRYVSRLRIWWSRIGGSDPGRFNQCSLLILACVVHAHSVANEKNWPKLTLPKEVSGFEVARETTVNGIPMRLQGFTSDLPPSKTAQAFRRIMGEQIVENQLGGKLILGRAQGNHYLSVQIEAAYPGSRGIVAVSDLKTAYERREESETIRANYLRKLPAGSRLVSYMSSIDGNKSSQHIVVMNLHGERLNAETLKSVFSNEGLMLERENESEPDLASRSFGATRNGLVQFYKGQGKEAMATIFRDASGQTTTVLTITTQLRDHP